MGKYLAFWAAMLPILASGVNADAMSAFARKYNVNCDVCHSKIPQLNEYGLIFKSNGFVIPGQKVRAIPGELPGTKDAGAVGAEPVKLPKVEVKLQPATSGDEKEIKPGKEKGDVALDKLPANLPASEPPATVVYKGSSRDGSLLYTDNPSRKDFVSHGKELPEKRKRAPVAARKAPAIVNKRVERVAVRKEQAPVAEKAETYRSHEECMERQFVKASQPASVQEMMDQLTAAELKCVSYETRKH